MLKRACFALVLCGAACGAACNAAGSAVPAGSGPGGPKYATFAVPLSEDNEYFRRAPAPDFWALMPYYTSQRDEVSCSLASLTMLVNSARRSQQLGSEEQLVTQAALFERVASPVWEQGLEPDGDGVTLDELAALAAQSLRAYGLVPGRVEATHVARATPEALARLRVLLTKNEASADDWLIFNFLARSLLGTGDYGHIAPVAAYDAERRRVLILDPDGDWYEPYWVPDHVALSGMATPDAVTGKPRGYLYVSTKTP